MKITLPNGVVLETETQDELVQLLAAMGVGKAAEEASDSSQWSVLTAKDFFASLKQGSRKLLLLILEHGDMTTTDVAAAFGYGDNRPVGGLTAAISNRARGLSLPSPISLEEIDGKRRVVMDVGFRAVAGRAIRNGVDR